DDPRPAARSAVDRDAARSQVPGGRDRDPRRHRQARVIEPGRGLTMAEPKKAGLFRYLKEAFLFRWNLLLLGGAGAAALLPGHADVALPLVAAAEVSFLAGLVALPRFQAAIDARAHAEE